MTRSLLLTLALMCENVNAAPQAVAGTPGNGDYGQTGSGPAGADPINATQQGSLPARMGREAEADSRQVESATSARADPAGVAPFTLSNPMCQTGFTIAMRFDERNAAGTITKSVWVRKCTNGRIVYGRKV